MSPSTYSPPILADRKPPACQGEDPELWFAGERQPLEQAAAVALCSICSQRHEVAALCDPETTTQAFRPRLRG